MQDSLPPEIDEDLVRLEAGIRQLKVQYDMFFAGALPRQPLELRSQIDKLIKQYTRAPFRKYAARFHFTALVGRYNALSELWAKTMRGLEEGPRSSAGHAERAIGDGVIATCLVVDAAGDPDRLRVMHARFLDARRKLGDDGAAIPFDAFVRGVALQTKRLRDKAGCEMVELRLVVQDRKVQLKARPGR